MEKLPMNDQRKISLSSSEVGENTNYPSSIPNEEKERFLKHAKELLKIERNKMKFTDVVLYSYNCEKDKINIEQEKLYYKVDYKIWDDLSFDEGATLRQDYSKEYHQETSKLRMLSVKLYQLESEAAFQKMFLDILTRGGNEAFKQAYMKSIVDPLRKEITEKSEEFNQLERERIQKMKKLLYPQ